MSANKLNEPACFLVKVAYKTPLMYIELKAQDIYSKGLRPIGRPEEYMIVDHIWLSIPSHTVQLLSSCTIIRSIALCAVAVYK
jgi:hypothetical protein